jgi:hypothetical protein
LFCEKFRTLPKIEDKTVTVKIRKVNFKLSKNKNKKGKSFCRDKSKIKASFKAL